jgi:hypothetical protein
VPTRRLSHHIIRARTLVAGVTRDTRPLAVAACPAHGAHHLLGPTMHSVALGRRRQPKHCSLRGPDPFEAASSGRRRLLTRPRHPPSSASLSLSASQHPFSRCLARAHFKPRAAAATLSRRTLSLCLCRCAPAVCIITPLASLLLYSNNLGSFTACARQLGRFPQYASQIRSCVKSVYNLWPKKAQHLWRNGCFFF